jgi:hypothetical protein
MPEMTLRTVSGSWVWVAAAAALAANGRLAAGEPVGRKLDARQAAVQVDELLLGDLRDTGATPAPLVDDDGFLRRVSFDLAGNPPAPREVLDFRQDADPDKRAAAIDRLLDSHGFATNQARYWRDVILARATNMRAPLAQRSFEDWLAEEIRNGRGWDEITTDILTATGDVRENGETALLFAHEGEPEEIAGEVARIFLGIQIQCANCHDHPWDRWKREQFHELAAYFPRVGVRPVREEQRVLSYEVVSVDNARRPGDGPLAQNPERTFRLLDRDRNGRLTRAELANTPAARFLTALLERGDGNQDGGLSLAELKNVRPPDNIPGRSSSEHYMSDLSDPSSRGTRIDPVFFVTHEQPPVGLRDLERREALARSLTSPENPWFAKALVNRVWTELFGTGFYTPVDDLGPERTPEHPEVLELLASGFVASDYDLRWLFRAITGTQAYQRQLEDRGPKSRGAFAAALPTRIRADQLYSALVEIAGIEESILNQRPARPGQGGGPYARLRSPRMAFNVLFGSDPSTPKNELTGTIPQALFLMNSQQIDRLTRAAGRTRLAEILKSTRDDAQALRELYLLVLSRDPSESEIAICQEYIVGVGDRDEAFEDIMWSLLNSSEFLTKR